MYAAPNGYAGHLMKCLTLVSRFFRILKSDTSRMDSFLDIVRGLCALGISLGVMHS